MGMKGKNWCCCKSQLLQELVHNHHLNYFTLTYLGVLCVAWEDVCRVVWVWRSENSSPSMWILGINSDGKV